MKAPLAVAALVAVAAVSLTACGDSGDDQKPSSGGATPVTFAALSIGQVAPIVVAKEQGIFKKHGIDLTIKYIEPSAVIPTLMSGDADFGWLNAPAVLAARTNHVPVKALTATSVAGNDPAAFPIQLVAPPGSGIVKPADLVGKTVAVDTLFQLPDLGMRAALLHAGVDPSKVKTVEIPFPNQGTALQEGKVDAILSTEPFLSIIESKTKMTHVLSGVDGQAPDTPQSVIVASEAFLGKHAAVASAFRAAIADATDYANAHKDTVRAAIPTYTKLDAGLAGVIKLAPIDDTDNPDGWRFWADLLVKVGAVKQAPDVANAFTAD